MRTTERITVTIPADLRVAMDRARRERRISTSAFITEAVRGSIEAAAEREAEARWIEGYLRLPPTEREGQLSRHGISRFAKRFDATPE